MSQHDGLNRRAFLRNAGMTALAGAVGSGSSARGRRRGSRRRTAGERQVRLRHAYNRFGTDSTKYDQQIRVYGKDSVQVGMGIADMDFTRRAVDHQGADGAHAARELGLPRHGRVDAVVHRGDRRLEQAPLRRRHRSRAAGASPTGVHPGAHRRAQDVLADGQKVLLQTPTYNGFYGDLTASAARKAEESPLKLVNGRYSMDFEDFERRISHDTNTFILCNPQNPTGNCWSPEDLLRLGEICLKRRVVVLADEIHCDFVTKGQKYTPFASLPNKAIVNNSITFKAASKSFGLAAIRCAWFYSTNATTARVKANHRADLTRSASIANQAAYAGGEEWLNQCVDYIDGNHDFVEQVRQRQHPDDQGRQAAGHLPDVARRHRGRRARSTRSSWPRSYNRTKAGDQAGADARADGRALSS